jgi:stage V sporulation protein B
MDNNNAQLKDKSATVDCALCTVDCALCTVHCKKRGALRKLLAVSVPITLGAMILPITQLIDSALVVNLLKRGGYSTGLSTALYGIMTGPVMSIVNMPVILSLAFATGAVPVFAALRVKGDAEGMRRQIGRGLRAAALFALPCAALVAVLSGPIVGALYGGGLKGGAGSERVFAAQLLTLSALDVFFIAVMQVSTAFLQAAGKTYLPVRNLGIGAVLKIVLNLYLIGRPSLHIYGAAIGTAACYAVAAALDVISVRRWASRGIGIGNRE